ncbi:MAG TPA: SurA N-terminal domain-containing protein, partial [Pyrinomonadaceae bacterium]|nr:SurA N-terminal domain-containing protein [Pyrinomonadaceae bacterium]
MPRVKQIASLVLLVVAACALGACNRASGGGATNDTAVAATVNGKNIMLREVDAILNQQAKGQQSDISHMSQLELAAGRLQVLDDLIRQEVLYQRAEKEGLLPKDEEVTQIIETQKQQNALTQDEYQKMLKETGQTEQDLRNTARKQLAIKNLLDRTGSKVGTPSEKEVADFFSSNRERYISARGVGLAAIIVDPN